MGKNLSKSEKIIIIGLLIALEVVLTRFLSIQLPTMRIGFGFLPVAVTAMLFGPITAAGAAVLGDLIGFFLFPAGSYFFGFTVSAAIRGLIFGLLLYRKELKNINIVIAAFLHSLLLTILIDTYWLTMLFGKAYTTLVPLRIGQAVVLFIVQIILIKGVSILLKSNRRLDA